MVKSLIVPKLVALLITKLSVDVLPENCTAVFRLSAANKSDPNPLHVLVVELNSNSAPASVPPTDVNLTSTVKGSKALKGMSGNGHFAVLVPEFVDDVPV